MFWIMLGPGILFLLGLSIARGGGGWFTLKDIAFVAVLAGLVLGRFVEFRGGDPRTATGEPATREHLRRYIVLILTIGLGVWIVANLIGNH